MVVAVVHTHLSLVQVLADSATAVETRSDIQESAVAALVVESADTDSDVPMNCGIELITLVRTARKWQLATKLGLSHSTVLHVRSTSHSGSQ